MYYITISVVYINYANNYKFFYFITENLNYFFTIDYDMVKGADGKDHWKILKHQTAYNADKVVYKFENVLGNKQLGSI